MIIILLFTLGLIQPMPWYNTIPWYAYAMVIPGIDYAMVIPGIDYAMVIPGIDYAMVIPGIDYAMVIPGLYLDDYDMSVIYYNTVTM